MLMASKASAYHAHRRAFLSRRPRAIAKLPVQIRQLEARKRIEVHEFEDLLRRFFEDVFW